MRSPIKDELDIVDGLDDIFLLQREESLVLHVVPLDGLHLVHRELWGVLQLKLQLVDGLADVKVAFLVLDPNDEAVDRLELVHVEGELLQLGFLVG